MKFTVKPDPKSSKWLVVNERDKVCHSADTKSEAEDIANQAQLLSASEEEN